MHLVSILMPIKNEETYLTECLNSIITQSYLHWELICVNDHSTDNTQIILDEYCHLDRRIKTFMNPGNGIIAALKTAYSHAQGTYITRMDADDVMAVNKIELLLNQLIQFGRSNLSTGLVRYFSHLKLGEGYKKYGEWLNNLTLNGTNYSEIYKECVIPSPCWMIHKHDLHLCGAFFPNVYPEDYDLCFRFYKNKMKIRAVNEILHYWRDYPIRTSRTDSHYRDNSFINLKVHHFLNIDHRPPLPLYLWGAGKKGKTISQQLIKKDIDFIWLTNNKNKLKIPIYDKRLLHIHSLNDIKTPVQMIIAVANPKEKDNIKKIINSKEDLIQPFYFA